VIYTIGHSTRTADAFGDLLTLHHVVQLADVRSAPYSRRHPQFAREALGEFLHTRGIGYRHFPHLGGMRKPHANSVNTGWREPGFRGYADYMQTPAFSLGMEELLQFAEGGKTAVMCAEAVWWRCHRRLLSDALLVRGVPVWHILSSAAPKPHELSEFARERDGTVIYPGLL
jgi:uncharacterized protein (DUF488 family)